MKSFITQERKAEAKPEPKPEPKQAEEAKLPSAEKPVTSYATSDESRSSKRRKGKRSPIPVGLIPVTVRLRPEIAAALKRASLERQLAGEETYTQQDLVELALEPWLIGEGHL
ncbi:hypothetical protein [Botrimarina sp.]|uniref:hypothetical protein n=1 Tax=Botrimarina sp. TaxID=2795802 RepID=UPI0032EB0316